MISHVCPHFFADAKLPNKTDTLFEGVKVLKYRINSIPDSHLSIISAYYSSHGSVGPATVNILGLQLRKIWTKSVYCNMHYSDGSTECLQEASKVELADTCNKYIRYATKISVIHTCKLSSGASHKGVPNYISLSSRRDCSMDSVKQIVVNTIATKMDRRVEFGVCVQTPLYGSETIQNIYEFIEAHKLLGVKMFTIYTQIKLNEFSLALHKIYEGSINIELIDWSPTFKRTYPVHYFGEVLSIHDCLYRNKNRVKYLALVDLDEIISPLQDSTWKEMFSRLPSGDNISGYVFDNTLMATRATISKSKLLKMENKLCSKVKVPKYLKILKRYACTYKSPRRSKVILFPERVSHMDIHAMCRTGIKNFHKINVSHNTSLLFHYRKSVPRDCKDRALVDANTWANHEDQLLLQMSRGFC